MIYLILGIPVFLIMTFFVRRTWINGGEYSEPHSFWACVGTGFMTLLICAMPCMVIYVVVLGKSLVEIDTSYTNTKSLVSLNDITNHEGQISGGFFLGIGVIHGSEEDVYKIRYATIENGIVRIKTMEMDEDNVGFVEDGGNKLVTTYYYSYYVFTETGKKLFLTGKPNYGEKDNGTTYIFHVPKGSIINDYSVDLN